MKVGEGWNGEESEVRDAFSEVAGDPAHFEVGLDNILFFSGRDKGSAHQLCVQLAVVR